MSDVCGPGLCTATGCGCGFTASVFAIGVTGAAFNALLSDTTISFGGAEIAMAAFEIVGALVSCAPGPAVSFYRRWTDGRRQDRRFLRGRGRDGRLRRLAVGNGLRRLNRGT